MSKEPKTRGVLLQLDLYNKSANESIARIKKLEEVIRKQNEILMKELEGIRIGGKQGLKK